MSRQKKKVQISTTLDFDVNKALDEFIENHPEYNKSETINSVLKMFFIMSDYKNILDITE